MKKIALTRGLSALVNDADFAYLNQWKWKANKTKPERTFYACRSLKRQKGKPRRSLLMHRVLMKTREGMHVDHVNGDGLDNRRINLRNVTPAKNALNRTRLMLTNKSGFTGVYWSKQKEKWHALIAFRSGSKHLGFFDDIKKAAKVVADFRREHLKSVL